jgi:hypothetical protein
MSVYNVNSGVSIKSNDDWALAASDCSRSRFLILSQIRQEYFEDMSLMTYLSRYRCRHLLTALGLLSSTFKLCQQQLLQVAITTRLREFFFNYSNTQYLSIMVHIIILSTVTKKK